MSKIAKLVTFEIITRVVIDETRDPDKDIELVYQEARKNILSDPDGHICMDNMTRFYNDTECPYGTFDGEEVTQ